MELEIIFAILIGLGIPLTAIPTVPGMLFMFILSIVYVVMDKGQTMDPRWLLLFGGLVLAAVLSDYISGLIGAKFGGASKKSVLLGMVGMVLGFLFFPPFGLFLGLFAGVFAGEMIRMKDHKHALKAAGYSFAGILAGMVFNVVLAIAFLVSFLVIVF